MKRGRLFSDVEITERRRVVIVNERLARTVWPGQDPIGKRLRWGLDTPQNPNPWLTVVGVVGDVADGRLGAPTYLHAYEPFSQFPDVVLDNVPSAFGRHLKLAVRTDGDPRALASPLRSTIAGIDPNLAVESIATMDDRIADSVAPRRFSAMTLAAFAGGGSRLLEAGWPCTTSSTCSGMRRCSRPAPTSTQRSEACTSRCGISRKLGNLASSLQAHPPADNGLLASRLPPPTGTP